MITKDQLPEKYHVAYDVIIASGEIPDAVKQILLRSLAGL